MKVLLIAATESEIQPFMEYCRVHWIENSETSFTHGQVTVDILSTGVGMVRTAFAMGNRLAFGKPDLCINAGIAGSFRDSLSIGEVVHVTRDRVYPSGAEQADGSWLSMREMELPEDVSLDDGLINTDAASYNFLPVANGVTVDLVHGSRPGIDKVRAFCDPDIETMESAAFFYACLKMGVPFVAMRSVSNMVEPRDRTNWDIPLAIKNLNDQLIELVSIL